MAPTREVRRLPDPQIDIDLGDTAIVVREFPDGMWTIDVPIPEEGPLVVTTDVFKTIVAAFVRVGKERAWL